jgi:hypothetical protein
MSMMSDADTSLDLGDSYSSLNSGSASKQAFPVVPDGSGEGVYVKIDDHARAPWLVLLAVADLTRSGVWSAFGDTIQPSGFAY